MIPCLIVLASMKISSKVKTEKDLLHIPLAKVAQGKVLTLSVSKAQKVNEYGPGTPKASKTIG